MEAYLKANNSDAFPKVLKALEDRVNRHDLSTSIQNMVKNVVETAQRGWEEPARPAAVSNIPNPYLNMDANGMMMGGDLPPSHPVMPCSRMYDFGGIEDEQNEEICRDFDQFLLSNNR